MEFTRGSQKQEMITGAGLAYGDNVSQLWLAIGQGAGFIKDQDIGFLSILHGLATFDQNTKLCPPACSHHYRCGSGKSHGTWAGDNQYGNKEPQRSGEISPTRCVPDKAGDNGNCHDNRNKVETYPVRHPGNRCL